MKKLIMLFAAVALMVSCVDVKTEETVTNAEPVKDGVFLHISEGYNDAHRVLMPMKMATLMAEDKDVLIYMDIHSVELLVNGAEDLNHEGFDSFQTYLKQLLDMGVGIYACPACMAVAGINPENLMDGIQTANKEAFFNFTQGRILSLDY
jgi:predicted peroxiredoxin